MKKIYIGGDNIDLIYDVSSSDETISRNASAAIQKEFDEAARQLGNLIRKKVQIKKFQNKK